MSEREKSRCAGAGPERTEQSPALNARGSLIKEKVRMGLFIYLQMCDVFVDETEQENKRTWNLTHDWSKVLLYSYGPALTSLRDLVVVN